MKYRIGDKVRAVFNEEITTIEATDGVVGFPYKAAVGGVTSWWAESAFEPLTLKEQYFRTGYVVERRNGNKYIVLRDGDKVALSHHDKSWSANNWGSCEDYDDDLIYVNPRGYSEFDIVKVYPQVCMWNEGLKEPIWQREEVEEITIEEAENIINNGITWCNKVKIVGNQEGRE